MPTQVLVNFLKTKGSKAEGNITRGAETGEGSRSRADVGNLLLSMTHHHGMLPNGLQSRRKINRGLLWKRICGEIHAQVQIGQGQNRVPRWRNDVDSEAVVEGE